MAAAQGANHDRMAPSPSKSAAAGRKMDLKELGKVRSPNTFLLLIIACSLLMPISCQSPAPEPNPPEPKPGGPFTIYYALNESHSNSWVRQSPTGELGVVYGVYGPGTGNHDPQKTGELIYRTIMPDGSQHEEAVTTDRGVDKCVLVYDSGSSPHIFYAHSDNTDQALYHLYKNGGGGWHKETAVNFASEGGKFIYELSADIDKKDSIHLLVLKIRSNPDSDDFLDCYQGAHLYHITNGSGNWKKTLIHHYDTFYTYDMVVKTQRRQDIAVDSDGHAHVVFGEQYVTPPGQGHADMARLHYATNKSGTWVREIALTASNTTDDSGWYPSLCLDRTGRPAIASTYVARVVTRSARYAQLCYSVRSDSGEWRTEVVAERDDGYYGTDGRNYTGALPHLEFDLNNRPHIVFSDIASSHNPQNVFCTGQIRYAVFNGDTWDLSTLYRQPSPRSFYECTEMGGQCLVISRNGKRIQVVGQEMVSTAEDVYTYGLVHFNIE